MPQPRLPWHPPGPASGHRAARPRHALTELFTGGEMLAPPQITYPADMPWLHYPNTLSDPDRVCEPTLMAALWRERGGTARLILANLAHAPQRLEVETVLGDGEMTLSGDMEGAWTLTKGRGVITLPPMSLTVASL